MVRISTGLELQRKIGERFEFDLMVSSGFSLLIAFRVMLVYLHLTDALGPDFRPGSSACGAG